jgi:MFS family permease
LKNWLTRTVLILSGVSLLNDIAGELLYPVLPLYMASIGYGAIWIGILEGLAEAVAGLTKGWFGEWSDKKGVRLPFVRFGYLLSALSKPLVALFSFAPLAILMRSTDRLGKGIRTGARDAMLADQAGKENRGKIFGFHRALDTTGAVIGPALALLWLAFHRGENYKSLFYFALIPGLICVLLLFLIKEKRVKKTTGSFPSSPFSSFGYWNRATPDFRKLVSGIVAFTLFNSSDMFLLLLVKTIFSKGILIGTLQVDSAMLVVGCYIFYNLVYTLFSYPAGFLSDKFSPKSMLMTGYVCFALAYGGMAIVAVNHSQNLFWVLTCFAVYGMYSACTDGVSKAWVSSVCKKNDKGIALGLYAGLTSIATLIASIMAGCLWTLADPSIVFLSAAVMSVIIFFYITFALKATPEIDIAKLPHDEHV